MEKERFQKEREEHLHQVEDNLPNGMLYRLVHDSKGGRSFVFTSKGCERLFHVTPESIKKDASLLYDLISPEDRQRLADIETQSIEALNPFNFECQVNIPNGDVSWYKWHSKPSRLANGSLVWDGVCLDISDLKEREEALKNANDKLEMQVKARTAQLSETVSKLREAELRYRTVADSAYDWTWWENPDKTFNYISPSCERITGYRAEEFIDNPKLLNQIILEEDRDIWVNHRREVIEEKNFQEIQFRIQMKDGGTCWIEHVCQDVVDEKGSFLGFRASNRDITERKAIEAESQQLRTALTHLDRVTTMGAMNAAIAHEINQPLTAILSNAQAALRFLRHDQPDLQEVEEALKDIVEDDKRAAEVIRRLRKMLKGQEPLYETFDLNAAIEEILRLVNSEIVLKDVSVGKDLNSHIPMLYGDYIQIQQVIINLFINALDALKDQPKAARHVLLSTRVKGNNGVTFSITDSGPGINPDRIETIFDPFYTMKPQGTGLGLPISRSIIEAHEGHLRAENHPDGGARFMFWLPIRKESDHR